MIFSRSAKSRPSPSWRVAAALGAAALLANLHGAAAQPLCCLPTCSADDGRFFAVTGSNLGNLSTSELDLEIAVPAGAATFTLGIFDGDANEVDGTGVSHWDTSSEAGYEYTLLADPLGDGTGTVPVELAPGTAALSSTALPDNAWIDYTVDSSPAAETPSGNFFYRLHIRLTTPEATTTNAFKVRTSGVLSGFPRHGRSAPLSCIANLRGLADLRIVYPAYPSATPTTYDGLFRLYFDLPVSQRELTVWDGDFDRGKSDGTELDTDDPDTPPAPPSWATSAAAPEGVAVGAAGTTGSPPDDRPTAGAGIYNSKPPSVTYRLLFPDGQSFENDNPSGNLEWEQFRISTDPFDRAEMDGSTASIPAGTYELRAQGVDMQNLNALLLPGRALCVAEGGAPATPLRPFRIGDTVFQDTNGNGVQDDPAGSEPGLTGVSLELVDELGVILATATTDADGHFSFPAEAETYTLRVADANFAPGGPLAGWISTTGSSRTETVVDGNVLTFDFGFRGTLSVGDRVWNDKDGNRLQDSGEHGISGVTVQLWSSAGRLLATATTGASGNYSFDHLPPGTYTVRLVASTLPAGLAPTWDADGVATPNGAVLGLAASRTDSDFGYRRRG